MNPLLTIFTATYNRAHLIVNLYASLKRQKNFDFEWLVVDDGSTDNTSELFQNILKEKSSFQIRYYKQENLGLIRALNRGISLAKGQYFAKIDSDDYVVDDYIETISNWIREISDLKDIYAVGGLKVDNKGRPLKGVWPLIPDKEYLDISDLERREKTYLNLDADMSEAWKTDVLRAHPFPVWPTEKFAPEQISFFQIAQEGFKIRWRAIPLVVCEYQEGGLSLGAQKLFYDNLMGYAMMYNQNMNCFGGINSKFRNAMQMIALSFAAGHLEYLREAKNRFVTILALLPGFLLGLRRLKQIKKYRIS